MGMLMALAMPVMSQGFMRVRIGSVSKDCASMDGQGRRLAEEIICLFSYLFETYREEQGLSKGKERE